ncbi:MAG: sulfite exporter TauE/SafE family protein [Thiogranum sp.]|nr:sulfite exporter TauE/SafE family protein [Thiogranum sp.]
MLTDISLVAAFLVGLLGGVHCVGMCGGIVGALSLGMSPRRRSSSSWPFLLAYNSGRILSYAVAGALLGGVAWIAANWSGLHQLQTGLHLLSALFMVALGLYLAGWWHGLTYVERAGGGIWRRIEPFGRRFLPVTNVRQAFLLGVIWGWLPCGLVYSVLVWAIATGSPMKGFLLMFSFGLGTLPNLLVMGLAADALAARLRDVRIRRAAGILVMLFGGYSFSQWLIQYKMSV